MKDAKGQYSILECVHNSGNSLLYKATDTLTGELVILKTIRLDSMDARNLAKLQHEQAILLKLASASVPEAVDLVRIDDGFFLVLKYYSGITLSEYIKERKISIKEFLHLARKIVSALSDVHTAGIIHKDINPANILYDHQSRNVTIIDFGNSTEFSYENPLNIELEASEGKLCYISPEQTGRMNRAMDFRTDFYSLGVTFFEMLCGIRPFESDSPTELIYAHVAKISPSAKKINPDVPEMISRIIDKLMAKMPEDRYLSSDGILFDLNRCLTEWEAQGGIQEFELGVGDFSSHLEILHKLYGREKEISSLEEAYQSILKGGKSFILIGGSSGIGKSSLVGELHRLIAKSDGLFISGKYDQYHRNIPYYALFQAIGNFCDIIFAENEKNIAAWKERITAALGEDGRLLSEKVPKLALLSDPLPELPALSPIEEGTRFHAVVQKLLTIIASPLHPLVVFIDDIHLINGPLDILEEILGNADVGGLLIISCYRDNEVDDSHPLIHSMNKMLSRKANIQQLLLSGLSPVSVVQILADALHHTSDDVRELAEIIYGKTLGNPFYIRQFISLCHMNEYIYFDRESRFWMWDLQAVKSCPAEENVIDFLIRNLDQLSLDTIGLLSLGACIGHNFSEETLGVLSGKGPEEIEKELKHAVSLEIIYSVQNTENGRVQKTFQFSHDRFQQAFYTVMPELERSRVHYELARYYQDARIDAGSSLEKQFLVADNYSKAFSIIDVPAEKRVVAGILYQAACSASLFSSYDTAVRYLEQIIESIPEIQCKGDTFEFSVFSAYHAALCNLSRYADADAVYVLLQNLAPEPISLTDSCCLQAVGLSNRGRYKDAFMLGVDLLDNLGFFFSEEDLLNTIISEIDNFYEDLRKNNYIGIYGKEEADDPKEFAIEKLLNRITAAGFFCDPLFSCWAIMTNARRILENGFTSNGLQLYADLTLVLTPFRNDYKLSYTAACKAKNLAEKNGYKHELFRIYHVFSLFSCHWFEDVSNSIPYARESYKGNAAVGDFEFACFSYFTTQQAVLETCQSVGELSAEAEAALASAVKTGNHHAHASYVSYAQLCKALAGKTKTYGSFDDSDFSEVEHLEKIQGNQMAQCYFYILRALSAVIYSDYDTAYELSVKVDPLMPAITGFYPMVTHNFIYSFSICRRMGTHACSEEEKMELLAVLENNQKWLGERAADAPMNFLHLYDFIETEKTIHSGLPAESAVLYEKAITEAESNNRPYHYALICEAAAQHLFKLNAPQTAANFMRKAYSAYLSWNAEGKIEQLRQQYHNYLTLDHTGAKGNAGTHADGQSTSTGYLHGMSIDFAALIKASQAISGEMQVEAILDKLMNVLQENAGAQDIYYLTLGNGGYSIIAEGHSEGKNTSYGKERPADAGSISLNVLNYVDRTHETVVLNNAAASGIFITDEHISSRNSRSVMCMPVISKGELKGVLYLENDLIEGAFDKHRIEALKTIASQLAISLENAYLYSNLQYMVSERTRELSEEIGIRRNAETSLEHLVNHDSLTNLPNRRMFHEHLEHAIEAAALDKSIIAVLFIDLDGFKNINDRYGHDKGDIVLVNVAQRFLDTVRSCDMVSRMGGDEFLLVIENVKSMEELEKVCERIIAAVKEPIIIDETGTTATVTSSIGISLSNHDGSTAEDLITNSDKAMYIAKNKGKNQYVFYSGHCADEVFIENLQ